VPNIGPTTHGFSPGPTAQEAIKSTRQAMERAAEDARAREEEEERQRSRYEDQPTRDWQK
jgi:hypothetical protein